MSETVDQSVPWFDADLAVVDVETTGLDSAKDRVIEIAVVHMRAGATIERWSVLVHPGGTIPDEIVAITGITNDMVKGAPRFEAIAADVRARLVGKVFVAYNHAFDQAFVRQELERAGLTLPRTPALDPLVFAREVQKDNSSKKLGKVAERLGISLVEAHRAANDAEVAGFILYAFRDKLPPILEDLVALQQQWSVQQEQVFAQRRKWRGQASEGDSAVTSTMAATRTADGFVLGQGYVYGKQPDPILFFYGQLPDVGATKKAP